MPMLSTRAMDFRSAIGAFIEARREAKQKGKEVDAGAATRFEYDAWLADAAHRVGQIQAVTHVLKVTHPDAKGTSLHIVPASLPMHAEIGTHLLGDVFAVDVVGNAAALDVFKFLKLEVDGKPLIDWMRAGDPDLQAALCDDTTVARDWMTAFASLVREASQVVTHPLAKQVYWLVGDEPQDDMQFHLLQPMTSSSLMHVVHADIQEARFGESNKLARQAFHGRSPCDVAYRDYRRLVARKLGGTKPQNVSRLNSERRGVNYLLASLPPPAWERDRRPRLLGRDTVMAVFLMFEDVRERVKELAAFLLSHPDPVIDTRRQRESLEAALGRQLAAFGVTARSHSDPGWTRHPDCRLPMCEQLWLDAERTELPVREDHRQEDEDFNTAYERDDWPGEVADRFALWLNRQLRDAGLATVGDAEHRHWASQAIIEAAWPTPTRRIVAGGRS